MWICDYIKNLTHVEYDWYFIALWLNTTYVWVYISWHIAYALDDVLTHLDNMVNILQTTFSNVLSSMLKKVFPHFNVSRTDGQICLLYAPNTTNGHQSLWEAWRLSH